MGSTIKCLFVNSATVYNRVAKKIVGINEVISFVITVIVINVMVIVVAERGWRADPAWSSARLSSETNKV